MFHQFTSRKIVWVGVLIVSCQVSDISAAAQQWQVGHPPLPNAVPQYTPQYPLDDATLKSPSDESPSITANPNLDTRNFSPTIATVPAPMPMVPATSVPATSVPAISVPAKTSATNNTATDVASQGKKNSVATTSLELSRDRNSFPIDPRKPCNLCTQPPQKHLAAKLGWPGLGGRPYQERELGGCQCGKKGCLHGSQFSTNWPNPFSALHERRHPSSAELRDLPCQPDRLTSLFDPLVEFRLVDYHRTDNGICGPDADRFGCLGESRYGSRVAGVGNRNPGEPAAVPVSELR